MRMRVVCAALAAVLAGCASAAAQGFPERPITFVVPFAAGGPVDVLARLIGDRMRMELGQPIVIEDVTGASGSLGVGRVARAPHDGYTVSIGHWGTHVVNGAIYDLPFDLLKDLDPVAALPANPQLIVARKGVPAANLQELIAWLKDNPGKATVGIGGVGGGADVVGTYF